MDYGQPGKPGQMPGKKPMKPGGKGKKRRGKKKMMPRPMVPATGLRKVMA